MEHDDLIDSLERRVTGIAEWLEQEAPYTEADQLHLVEHSPERAYWHHGYACALMDILKLIGATARS